MVATRRQVQAVPDEEMVLDQDPNLILRKKPVRRGAAKTTTTKPETKARTTRGKKAEPESDAEVLETETVSQPSAEPAAQKKTGRGRKAAIEPATAPSVDEVDVPAKPTRATETGSVRGKRGLKVDEKAPMNETADEPKPTRTTKAASMRGQRAAPQSEEALEAEEAQPKKNTKAGSVRGRKVATAVDAPSLPAPEAKPTRQTRGATAKPQPLSPKKITQVSKPQTRNTRTTGQKPTAKTIPAQARANSRNTTRKRTVSDENADVPNFQHDIELAEGDDDAIMLSSTPAKTKSTRADKIRNQALVAESEASMSSRPTTPTDSAQQSFSELKDDFVPEVQDEMMSDVEEDAKVDSDASEDELCGPKTPMKRSSPAAFARYQSSVQRTIRKYEDGARMETPVQRFNVLGTQRGTPQTTKPYCKPVAPSSGTKSMTVARGSGRAFVFKDLRVGAPALRDGSDSNNEDTEISFIPDEDIIPLADKPVLEEPVYLHAHQELAIEGEDDDATTSISGFEEDGEGFVAPAAVQKYSDDPDDTVIIQDVEDSAPAYAVEPAASFNTDDTVLITRSEQPENVDTSMGDVYGTEYCHDETEGSQVVAKAGLTTPKVGQYAPITVNFDEHLNDARAMRDFSLAHSDIESDNAPVAQIEEDANLGAEMEVDQYDDISQNVSRRQTLNFNEFIDVAALSEPTAVLNIPEEVAQSGVPHENASSLSTPSTPPVEDREVLELDLEPNTISEEVSAAILADEDTAQPHSVAEHNAVPSNPQSAEELFVPHYALPTIAFDARRKSLPAVSYRTPVKAGSRPNTSDGASIPRIANPFANAWWMRSRAGSTAATPVKARPDTAHGTPHSITFGTPAKFSPSKEALSTPKERYPVLSGRQNYEGHANTVAAPARFGTPSHQSPKRRDTLHKAMCGKTVSPTKESAVSTPASSVAATPEERYPKLGLRNDVEGHAQTVAAPVRFQKPAEKSPKRRDTFHKAVPGQIKPKADEPEPATPSPSATVTRQETPNERYPRLRPRQNYEDHAKTVAGPIRFQTPAKTTPRKRPATIGKSDSLRKAALVANTPVASNTPMKTPLKAPAVTPSQVPMTPHPAAPLRGVVALVEVFTLEGASASSPFVALLQRLGAKTTRAWNDRITHVVFKDGSPTTLQRVRLCNKEVEEKGTGTFIHCVNSRWVTDCDTEGARMDESGEAYAVDVAEVPRGGKRRRKSMEPSALLNLGGNIVRDRKSSSGRVSSLSRSPLKLDSPAKKPDEAMNLTQEVVMMNKENSGDEQGSPATPAYLAAPENLVQQTAPMHRVRKLELRGNGEAKNRRLTFWSGA